MLRGPTPPSGRLSKKSRAEAGEARGGPPRCRSAVVGRGRDALGPKAGEQQEGVGADREEAHGPLQERIRVDLPLRLPQARKRRGLLDDPAHSEHRTVLFGARGVRKGGGSRHRQAHPFGLGQGRMAHRRGGRPTRRRASGVATLGFTGATTGGKVVAANQRGVGQRPLRGDRRGRANADEPMYGTARSKRADKGPHQLPLVAAGGMTFRELFSRIRYQTLLDHREDHELVRTLYLYRKKANTLSRYSRWILDFYEDGRMYPQPKVAAAVTGRVLYSDPNAQGIDKKKTEEFRRCVKAEDGRAIVKGDFAQQELRIAAYYSKDKNMLDAFAKGEDIYLKTAAKLVGKPVGKDHPARQAAKRATLGFLYGLGTEKYRQNVYKDTGERLSASQAKKDREAFRAAFPEFYRWQQIYGAKHEWETRSALGWRRVVAPDKDNKPKYTERLNGPIQSTAGDILYLTLKKLAADPRPGTHFLLSVHDELVLECPKEDARRVALWLKAKMGEAMEEILGKELSGPACAEVGYGPSWGEYMQLEES